MKKQDKSLYSSKWKTEKMRAVLDKVGSTLPPIPIPLPEDSSEESEDVEVEAQSGVIFSRKEVETLTAVWRDVGEANLQLIEEVEATRNQMEEARRWITKLSGVVIAGVVGFLCVISFKLSGMITATDEISKEMKQASTVSASLDQNVKATLGAVRATADVVAAKIEADTKAMGPNITPEGARLRDQAERAQRTSLEAEIKMTDQPKKRDAAVKALNQLNRAAQRKGSK